MTNDTVTCLGVILDGNRRWAKEQGLPTYKGHQEGFENLKRLSNWAREAGIPHLVVYAFSTENWKRGVEEVGYLMDMMRAQLKKHFSELRHDDVAVHIIGDMTRFPEDIQNLIGQLHASNPKEPQGHVWIAASYGGRAEIVAGVNTLLAENKTTITEDEFARVLWTAGMPDPDIVIRTGGDRRLSNFLTWSSVYAELFFLDTFWPAFTKDDFLRVLEEYAFRKRNFGR